MISRAEILKGEPCPSGCEANLNYLLECINKLRLLWNKPMIVTSGYRTVLHNKAIGGAKLSNHVTCRALDIQDLDGSLKAFCRLNDYKALIDCNLYMESGDSTLTWAHFQTKSTSKREFIP